MKYNQDCCCMLKYMGSAYFTAQKGGYNMSCCGKPIGPAPRPMPIGRPVPLPFGPRR